jgi:hypothetical protein
MTAGTRTRLRAVRAVARELGVAPKTLFNLLYKHREMFRERRYRGRWRALTDAEVVALETLLEVRVK